MLLRKPKMGTRFRDEQVFRSFFRFEQLFDTRQGANGGGDTGLNGVAGTFEIVPSKVLDIGAQHEIRMAFPGFELVLLRGGHRSGHYLKNVLRRTASAVLNADGDGKHPFGAKLTSGNRGDLCDETSVSKGACADFDWFKKAGERATGANGIYQAALCKDHRIASGQVGRYYGHRNLQIFELFCLENAVH